MIHIIIGTLTLAALAASFAYGAPRPDGTWCRVDLRPRRPPQGAIVQAAIHLPEGWTPSARFGDRDVPLSRPARTGPHRALIGVDVLLEPGLHELEITARSAEGAVEEFEADLEVVPGRFNIQRLKVEPRMADPDLLAKARIEEEEALVKRVLGAVSERAFDGPFRKPVPGPITARFGARRVFNRIPKNPHAGIDLRAAEGTEVLAAAPGTVALVKELYFAGNCVIVDHGAGLFTSHAHLSEPRVRAGQQVRRGEILGLSGRTGRVTGPHLHWGATLLGARVDPSGLLHLDRWSPADANRESDPAEESNDSRE